MFGQFRPAVKNLLTVANSWTADQTFTTVRRAISAATVQNSVSHIWEASAWNTNTSTSGPIAYKVFAQGVSGSPGYGRWKLQYSLNNAAYSDAITWDPKGLASSKALTTLTGFAKVASDNSSTVDTLLTLDVNSSGSTNHVGLTFGSTVRSAWSVGTTGTTEWKTAGSSPLHNFYIGSTITSQSLIMQLFSSGIFTSLSMFAGAKVTAGSADTSVQTTLSTYGSLAAKGILVTASTYTLAETETFVYVDPTNTNVCGGTPTACSTYVTEGNCNTHSGVGCSWFAGNSCGAATGTDSGTCTGQGAGCTWDEVPCSSADNTDQSTCENQDDAYGGSCSWDTSTCPSQTSTAACNSITGCTADVSGDCGTLSDGGGDGTACATQPECSYDNGTGVCSGTFFVSCSGNLCTGNYFVGTCSGIYGAACQGTADCANLTDDGSVVCAAESGCSWVVGITVTLPTNANANRSNTGRVYSILHAGSTGTVIIQGQSGEPIFQYTTLSLLKKGDKVILHNQNISFPCNLILTQTPCTNQTGCSWTGQDCHAFDGTSSSTCTTGHSGCSWSDPSCSSNGDQSSCETAGCVWNGSTCIGNCSGSWGFSCTGTYDNGSRWYAHSLERGLNYVEKTATYTVLDIDDVVNCTSGTFTLNLPGASLNNGKKYHFRNSGAGTITVDGSGSETINGTTTVTITAGNSLTIVSNNSNWISV